MTGEKIDVETKKCKLESKKLRQDISQARIKDTRESLAYHGQMKDAAIEKRRQRKEQIVHSNGNEEAAETKIKAAREKREEKGTNYFSLSQDSLIGQYLDYERTILNSARDE